TSSSARTSAAAAASLSRVGSVPDASGIQPKTGTPNTLATESSPATVGWNVSSPAAMATPTTDPTIRASTRSIGSRDGSGLEGIVALSITEGVGSDADPRLDQIGK